CGKLFVNRETFRAAEYASWKTSRSRYVRIGNVCPKFLFLTSDFRLPYFLFQHFSHRCPDLSRAGHNANARRLERSHFLGRRSAAARDDSPGMSQDRKSTRLNSSHIPI